MPLQGDFIFFCRDLNLNGRAAAQSFRLFHECRGSPYGEHKGEEWFISRGVREICISTYVLRTPAALRSLKSNRSESQWFFRSRDVNDISFSFFFFSQITIISRTRVENKNLYIYIYIHATAASVTFGSFDEISRDAKCPSGLCCITLKHDLG